MSTKEFRVRPVVRHIVTEFTPVPSGTNSVSTLGEFDNEAYAELVKNALEEQAAPREFAIVKLDHHNATTEVTYRYTREDADDFVATRRAEREEWRIYSRPYPG